MFRTPIPRLSTIETAAKLTKTEVSAAFQELSSELDEAVKASDGAASD